MGTTTYTFETASPGWTEQTNNFSVATAHNTASTICSQQGYFNNSPVLFGGTYYNESVIQSDAAIDADSITVYFNAVNGTYTGGYLNQVTIKYASSPSGPWTGGGSFTFGSVTNFGADGCQSLTFTPGSGVTGQYFRVYVNVNGATAAVESYIYKVEVTAAAGLRLYTGSGSLTERSDLTITGIKRGAFVVRSSGSVVVGTSESGDSVVVEQSNSDDTYATWDDLTDSHPTGVITSIKEI